MCCINGILALQGKIIIEAEYYNYSEIALYAFRNWAVVKQMMHVLSHTDIFS